MNNPKISIIVPVYNLEKYIHRCINSILSQTFTSFECILVNDCSPDNCPVICDEYAKKDGRIKVIHKIQNEGLSQARKTGIEHSSGDYIQFVDADDWIEPIMSEKLFNAAIETGADIVYCDYYKYDSNGCYNYKKQVFDTNKINNLGFVRHPVMWNKFFKRDIFNNVTFPKVNKHEDRIIFEQIMFYAKKWHHVSYPLYHYFYNPKSMANFKYNKTFTDEKDIILYTISFLKNNLNKEEFRLIKKNVNNKVNKLKLKYLKNKNMNINFYRESNFLLWLIKHLYKTLFPFAFRSFLRALLYFIIYFPKHISYIFYNNKNFEFNLAISTTVQNEGAYLIEWIEYHRIVGVDKFIIYNNEGTDNSKEILQPYIDSGIVDFIFWPGRGIQKKANNNTIKKYKNKVKYISFSDVDEFIVPVQYDTILQVMDKIESETKKAKKHFVGLAVKNVNFGFNGHYTKPSGLVIENYTKSEGMSAKHHKCLINPRAAVNYNVHYGNYLFNRPAVNENGIDIFGTVESSKDSINKIKLNHYYTKSYEEYKFKREKGSVNRGVRNLPMVEYDPLWKSTIEDKSIKRFIPVLKQRLSKENEY